MWQLHQRMPACKLRKCAEAVRVTPVDLTHLIEVMGIQFATVELVEVAAQCLNDIAQEIESAIASTDVSDATATASSHDDKQSMNDKSDSPAFEKESKTTVEESADKSDSHKGTTDQCAAAQGSSQSASTTAAQPQDASASRDGPDSKKESDSTKSSSQNWITHFVKAGHDLLWPSGMAPTTGPTLLFGVRWANLTILLITSWNGSASLSLRIWRNTSSFFKTLS